MYIYEAAVEWSRREVQCNQLKLMDDSLCKANIIIIIVAIININNINIIIIKNNIININLTITIIINNSVIN